MSKEKRPQPAPQKPPQREYPQPPNPTPKKSPDSRPNTVEPIEPWPRKK